jgi:hypothetical protein
MTPVAVPGPPLFTVTVKPIGVPALTVAASAFLVMVRLGAWTRMLADALTLGALVAEAVAEFM